MDFDHFVQIISNFLSKGSASDQEQAASTLNQFKEENPIQYLHYLANLLLTDSDNISLSSRQCAVVFLKNVLKPTKVMNVLLSRKIWKSIPSEERNQIKQGLVRGLMFESEGIRNSSANLLALIEQVEIGENQWPTFFNDIAKLIIQDNNEYGQYAILGGLETLNEFFRIPSKPPLINQTRKLGINFYNGIRDLIFKLCFELLLSDAHPKIKKITVDLLTNAIRTSFSIFVNKEQEIQINLTKILEQNFVIDDMELHGSLYKLMIQYIKSSYTSSIPMDIIFNLVTEDMKSNDENLKKTSLRFWKKVSKVERNLVKFGKENQNFTAAISEPLLPFILQLIPQFQDGDEDDETDNSINKCAVETLNQFCKFAPGALVKPIGDFFIQNFRSEYLPAKYTAYIAMRAIAKFNQSDLSELLICSFETIVNDGFSNNPKISEAAILLAGDIVSQYKITNEISDEFTIVTKIFEQLLQTDTFNTQNGCVFLCKYLTKFKTENIYMDSPLELGFKPISELLLSLFDRKDIFELNLIKKASEALIQLIFSSPYSTIMLRIELCRSVLIKAKRFIQDYSQTISLHNIIIYVSELLSVFQSCLSTFPKGACDFEIINEMFNMLYEMFTQYEFFKEIIYGPFGYLITNAGENASNYVEILIPILLQGQQSQSPTHVSNSSITIGDMYRSIPNLMLRYTDTIVNLLYSNIISDVLPFNLISEPIANFGDIIRNIGEYSESYREQTLNILRYYYDVNYDPESKGDVVAYSNLISSLIYLSGSLVYSCNDSNFLTKETVSILFKFKDKISVEIFHAKNLIDMIITFVEMLSSRTREYTIKYNIQLNCEIIIKYLAYASKCNINLSRKASQLLAKIRKC